MAGLAFGNSGDGPKTRLMAEINITPMVDVMLVLLVIFMVTAPLLVAGVRIDLPRNAAPKISTVDKPIVVTLAAEGGVYLGEEQIALDTLEPKLDALHGQRADATVFLRADRKLPYGEILSVLARIGQTGFQKISLLSQADPKPVAPASTSRGSASAP